MDDEDFLAAVEADNANVPVEEPKEPDTPAPAEPTPEPVQEAPAEPEPAPANPLTPPVLETKPDPGFVPINVVLDEREKRQKLEQELERLRSQQQQPQAIPDQWEDPEGYTAYQDQKVQQVIRQTNLNWSKRIATIEHGKETVDQAAEWGFQRCETDPYFNAKVAASDDPIGFVVSEWKREQIASQVTPDDFAQFQAWKAAQAQLQAAPAVAPAPSPAPRAVPPRSIASAPSAGGVLTEVEPTEQDIFEGAIPKR